MLYLAHGLRLNCSFPLPGMPPVARAGEDLPPLAIDLRAPQQLEETWSGADGPPEWRGRQGDGRELAIERGRAGDVLFTYDELARFRLDADMRRLECAPGGPDLDWQRLLIGKVIPSISVMRGYEGLHAAAVQAPDGVVAIMAQSGSGKSTLALELMSRGWPLFADDTLMLREHAGEVRAHPGTPHMNLAADALEPRRLGETIGVLAGERWLAAHATAAEPRQVRMLCLLERAAGQPLELQALPANPLALAPFMLGLSVDPQRRAGRFCLYSNLSESATLVRLSAGLEHRPQQLADLIEQALASERRLVAGGIG